MNRAVPTIAILTSNVLMGIGLRSILERMLPFAACRVYDDFSQIEQSSPEEFFHLFVVANMVVEHRDFFECRRHKSIVLTTGTPLAQLLDGYAQIDVSASQEQIEASLMRMHSSAHGAPHMGEMRGGDEVREVLSPREIEVLKLVVEGCINREIAERLNIALATVITHRKNIVDKLGIRSVAGLAIYAVMKRYIEI